MIRNKLKVGIVGGCIQNQRPVKEFKSKFELPTLTHEEKWVDDLFCQEGILQM